MLIAYLIIFLAYWGLFTMGYNVACDLLQHRQHKLIHAKVCRALDLNKYNRPPK